MFWNKQHAVLACQKCLQGVKTNQIQILVLKIGKDMACRGSAKFTRTSLDYSQVHVGASLSSLIKFGVRSGGTRNLLW